MTGGSGLQVDPRAFLRVVLATLFVLGLLGVILRQATDRRGVLDARDTELHQIREPTGSLRPTTILVAGLARRLLSLGGLQNGGLDG